MRRSTGAKTGVKNVRSPSKTRAMYEPSGFVSSSTSPKKKMVCSHPIAVIVLDPLAGDRKTVEEIESHEGRQYEDEVEHRRGPQKFSGGRRGGAAEIRAKN